MVLHHQGVDGALCYGWYPSFHSNLVSQKRQNVNKMEGDKFDFNSSELEIQISDIFMAFFTSPPFFAGISAF